MIDTLDDIDFEKTLKKVLEHISKEHGRDKSIDQNQIVGTICLYADSDLDDMGDIYYEGCCIFDVYMNLGVFCLDCIDIGASILGPPSYFVNWGMLK